MKNIRFILDDNGNVVIVSGTGPAIVLAGVTFLSPLDARVKALEEAAPGDNSGSGTALDVDIITVKTKDLLPAKPSRPTLAIVEELEFEEPAPINKGALYPNLYLAENPDMALLTEDCRLEGFSDVTNPWVVDWFVLFNKEDTTLGHPEISTIVTQYTAEPTAAKIWLSDAITMTLADESTVDVAAGWNAVTLDENENMIAFEPCAVPEPVKLMTINEATGDLSNLIRSVKWAPPSEILFYVSEWTSIASNVEPEPLPPVEDMEARGVLFDLFVNMAQEELSEGGEGYEDLELEEFETISDEDLCETAAYAIDTNSALSANGIRLLEWDGTNIMRMAYGDRMAFSFVVTLEFLGAVHEISWGLTFWKQPDVV